MLKHVLLVDDSAISRMMLREMIEENFEGITIAEAGSAEHAIARCEVSCFDGIFLDINMPGQDGLSVAPRLQALCPHVCIALLTSNFQDSVKIKAKESGLGFYAKPVTLDKVKDFVCGN